MILARRRGRGEADHTQERSTMPRITPNLWFDDQAQEAAAFYTSVFPNSRIAGITHYGQAGPREAGTVMTVELRPRRPGVHRDQRRPPVHVRRGGLVPRRLLRPGRDRLLLGGARRGRRGGSVRMGEGPVRPLLAGLPDRDGGAPRRSGRGAPAPRHGGHPRDGEDRPRRAPRRRRRAVNTRGEPRLDPSRQEPGCARPPPGRRRGGPRSGRWTSIASRSTGATVGPKAVRASARTSSRG